MEHPETKAAWTEYLNEHDAELVEISIGQGLNSTRMTVRCRKCGAHEANIRAANLVRRKSLCTACNGRESYSTESIRDLINSKGGIYIAGEVVDRDSLIRLNCPGCQREVEKRAQDVRRRPDSCSHCRRERGQQTTLRNNDNLARAHRIAEERGGRCLTENALVSMSDKLSFVCSLGHRWESSLNCVEYLGTWCPDCATSRGERTVRAVFEAAYDEPFPQARPEFLSATLCHLDGYNQDLNLAFEVNGSQHYQRNAQFHRSDEDLRLQQERDHIKAGLCAAHGICLVTVPYWVIREGMQRIREFLAHALAEAGIPPKTDLLQVEIDSARIYDITTDVFFREFETLVREHNGHFDSKNYLGKTVNLPVTCAQGHTWEARPDLVMRGHWCPDCAGILPVGFDVVQQSLQEADWSLDEDNDDYQKAGIKLRLRCPRGHLVVRSWNRWQQQQAKGQLTCEQCIQEDRAQEFVDKMLERGFRMDVDLSTYEGAGQPVRGVCIHCAQETTLPVPSWKNRSLAPCCCRSLPAYHRCHRKSANKLAV